MKRPSLVPRAQQKLIGLDSSLGLKQDPNLHSRRSSRALAIEAKGYSQSELRKNFLSLSLLVIALLAAGLLARRASAQGNVAVGTAATQENNILLVSDFRNAQAASAEVAKWSTLTDRARPDRRLTGSTAELVAGTGAALFQGELVLEDGAGFASIRRSPDFGRWDVRALDRVMIEVTGDRREYRVLLKDALAQAQGYSYQATWATNGRREVMSIPLNQFVPVKRGQVVTASTGPLDLSQIVEVGIQLNDGNPGQFQLAIEGFWFER